MSSPTVGSATGRARWLITGTATVVLAVVLGVFGSIGVLIDPLAAELAASRGQLVLLFAAALAVHTIAARGAGRLLDRYGPRPLLAVAGAGMGGGLLAPALADSAAPALIGYGLGLGLASACSWVATTAAVGTAGHPRRTAALGLLTAGPAVGGAVLAPVMTVLARTWGVRPTCALLAALGVAVCTAGALVLDRRPDAVASAATVGAGPDLRPLVLAAGLMGLVVFLPLVHIVGAAGGLGLSAAAGAAVLSVISVASAGSRLVAGWLSTPDRLPTLYRAAHLTIAAGFLTWALVGPGDTALPLLLAAGMVFGAGYGAWLALGPALLVASCPPARLGRALGSLAAASGIGGVVGPVLAGPLVDQHPTVLWAGAAVIALVAAAGLRSITATPVGRTEPVPAQRLHLEEIS